MIEESILGYPNKRFVVEDRDLRMLIDRGFSDILTALLEVTNKDVNKTGRLQNRKIGVVLGSPSIRQPILQTKREKLLVFPLVPRILIIG